MFDLAGSWRPPGSGYTAACCRGPPGLNSFKSAYIYYEILGYRLQSPRDHTRRRWWETVADCEQAHDDATSPCVPHRYRAVEPLRRGADRPARSGRRHPAEAA